MAAGQGFTTDLEGGGEVSIVPQENAQTLETFRAGAIDGLGARALGVAAGRRGWAARSWSTRPACGRAAGSSPPTSSCAPSSSRTTRRPCAGCWRPKVAANEFVNTRPAEAKALANQGIEKITQKPLATALIDSAWPKLTFTNDPIAASLVLSASPSPPSTP